MSIYDRLKQIVKYLVGQGIAENQEKLGNLMGYSNKASFSHVLNGRKPLPEDFINRICSFDKKVNKVWIEKGEGHMLLSQTKDEAILINHPNIIMVPLVSQYAYAGYLSGYTDPEYMEALPKIPMFVDHEAKGGYMAFEVRGDSMEEDSRDGIFEGDKLYCRIIKPDLWQYKLHIKQWDFVIVHKTEGILIKRIIDHNIETGDITIHSLNPMYPDKVLNLKDVAQLFNVIETARGRRR